MQASRHRLIRATAGPEQRLYLGSTGSYVTFDDSSSTIDSLAGTINLSGVSGGTLTNGEQVTFERYVPYSTSQTVTMSAAQTAAYTAYYTQEARYRAVTGVAGNQLSFASATGFTTGQAVVYKATRRATISGLVDGQTYYVIGDPTATTLELASSEANAQAGKAITLTDAPNLTGTPGIKLVNDPVSGRTDLTNYVNSAIQTLKNQQTQEYQTLNATWGQVGNIEEGTTNYDAGIWDPSFSYSAGGPELIAANFAASAITGNVITIGANSLITGQAITFEDGGALGRATAIS